MSHTSIPAQPQPDLTEFAAQLQELRSLLVEMQAFAADLYTRADAQAVEAARVAHPEVMEELECIVRSAK